MTTIHHLPGSILGIELPRRMGHRILINHDINEVRIYYLDYKEWVMTRLKAGIYQVLGWSDDESVAELVVRKVTLGYWLDYEQPNKRHDHMCCTPIDSLSSLLRTVGCGAERLLLLKRID